MGRGSRTSTSVHNWSISALRSLKYASKGSVATTAQGRRSHAIARSINRLCCNGGIHDLVQVVNDQEHRLAGLFSDLLQNHLATLSDGADVDRRQIRVRRRSGWPAGEYSPNTRLRVARQSEFVSDLPQCTSRRTSATRWRRRYVRISWPASAAASPSAAACQRDQRVARRALAALAQVAKSKRESPPPKPRQAT